MAISVVPASPDRVNARKNYKENGKQSRDLSDPAQVRDLIANSPQVDGDNSTKNDEYRCGAASMFNATLVDGDYRANASALEASGRNLGVAPNKAQQKALNSMSEGHLSPAEAAQLQEYTFKVADATDGSRHRNAGLDTTEIRDGLKSLQQNGGFPNTQDVAVDLRNVNPTPNADGSYNNHYVVTTTDKNQNRTYANSWPNADGKATVTTGVAAPAIKGESDFGGRITLHSGLDGKSVEELMPVDSNGKLTYGQGGGTQSEAVVRIKEVQTPSGPVQYDAVYDPQTGKPLSREAQQAVYEKVKAANSSGGNGGAATEPPPAPKRSYIDVAPIQYDATGHIASKEVGVGVAAYSKGAAYQSKNVQASAGVQLGSASAYAGASASVDLKNLKINAEVHAGVEANLVDAQASANVRLGNIGDLGGNARAKVGADAVGGAGVGFDPKQGTIEVGAQGEAFTGARANAAVNLALGPVGAHAGVAVQAGVGIMGAVDVGLKNGKFHFGLDFGFSLGIGLRINLGFDIDFKAIGKGIVDGVKAIGKGVKKLGKAIGKGAKKMAKAAKKAVKWMGKTAKKTLKKVGKKAKKAVKKLKKLGKKVGHKIKGIFKRHKHKHHKKVDKNQVKQQAPVKHEHHHIKALKKAMHLHGSSFEYVA